MAAADAEADADAGGATESVDRMTVTVRAEVLQDVVDQLLTIVDEAIFRIGYEGLSVAAVDPANVGMVMLEVEPAAFESVGDGMFPIGLNLERLDDYIGGASGADPVTLSYRPERRSIEIEHTNVEVEMAGIDPDAIRDEPDIPAIDPSVEFETDAGLFVDAVENADLASDHVRFKAVVDDGEVVVIGEGDTDEIKTEISSEDISDGAIKRDAESLFSLNYLISGGMLKPLGSGTDLRVEYSEDHPVKMHYDFADGLGHVTMMLAPRVGTN
ncbi:DNA polymerase [Haloparvum sedimenti]|uniref:DNA polymerase n=1 Tax=Haloparvum sedimenti TaxID=1678448 RepID=UPI00071E9C8B|nr:DNA polymerase [Haloparvum sedimenti]